MVVLRKGDPKFRARICEVLLTSAVDRPVTPMDVAWKLHIQPDDQTHRQLIGTWLSRLYKMAVLSMEPGRTRNRQFRLQDPVKLAAIRDRLMVPLNGTQATSASLVGVATTLARLEEKLDAIRAVLLDVTRVDLGSKARPKRSRRR